MPTTRTPAAKKTSRTRKPAARTKPAVAADPIIPQPVSEEERQAKLTAYTALKSAGIDVPAELAAEVETWIAEEQKRRELEAAEQAQLQAALDEENAKGPWYVRNGYRAEFNLRLDRQTEKRRISLKPRGNPGDMHPLEDGDLKDPNLIRNVNLGVIEVIPAGVAQKIMEHQTHNMGPRIHTPTALLRNPLGQPYDPANIKVEAEFNQQGITVATLDPNQMQGHVTDKEVGSNRSFGGLQRVQPGVPAKVSEFVPTGGNPAIIQNGPTPLGGLGENTAAKIADDLARRKGVSGPGAGLGGLQVVVAPAQKGEVFEG